MRQFVRNLVVATACSLGLVTSVFGQSVGDEIVVITEKADLKNESTVVETTYRGGYYKVRAVNGKWLSISHRGTVGWLSREQVILASRALDHFTNELRRNPKDEVALIARSLAWKERGELTNAIRDCTDAIAINSEYYWGFQIRGLAWKAKKEFDLAISDFEEGIRLSPKGDACYFNRGLCYYDKKHFDKAIADFTEAIRLNPKDAQNYECRGDSYRDKEQYDKALADYTMAVELDSANDTAFASRAWVHYHKKHDYQKALADYSKAISIDPNFVGYRHWRGDVFVKLRQNDLALQDYETAVKMKAENAMGQNNLAWLLATCPSNEIRNGKRAVEHAKKAVELAKDKLDRAYYLDTLAAAYAEAGNFAKAIETENLALAEIDADSKAELEEHLKLFQEGQPFRDIPKPTEVVNVTATK